MCASGEEGGEWKQCHDSVVDVRASDIFMHYCHIYFNEGENGVRSFKIAHAYKLPNNILKTLWCTENNKINILWKSQVFTFCRKTNDASNTHRKSILHQ